MKKNILIILAVFSISQTCRAEHLDMNDMLIFDDEQGQVLGEVEIKHQPEEQDLSVLDALSIAYKIHIKSHLEWLASAIFAVEKQKAQIEG